MQVESKTPEAIERTDSSTREREETISYKLSKNDVRYILKDSCTLDFELCLVNVLSTTKTKIRLQAFACIGSRTERSRTAPQVHVEKVGVRSSRPRLPADHRSSLFRKLARIWPCRTLRLVELIVDAMLGIAPLDQ